MEPAPPAEQLPSPRPITDTVRVPHRLTLGLAAIDPGEPWLEVDANLAADLREKRRLLAAFREQVFVELPSSREAQREVLALVLDAVTRQHPSLYARAFGKLELHALGEALDLETEMPPLETAARCVQEDLCVMEKGADGWCLTAGAVCFPTRWELVPKLGRSMTEIHEPVPGYREQLDHPSNRFFDGMKGGTVFRRGNWSLLDDPSLFLPTRKVRTERRAGLGAHNAGENVWLRVEHQTLQRLPRTGAILFGIRIHRTRLDEVARDPEAARAVLGAVETMDPAMQRYKSLELVREAAVGYLSARLNGA